MNTPWILGVAGLSVAFAGPDLVTLGALLGVLLEGEVWGAGAGIVGVAGRAIQFGGRLRAPSPRAVRSS